MTDTATREPIGGAVLVVSDSGGRFLARSIADRDGRYSVLRLFGSYKLRVVRIGYRPVEALIGSDSALDLRMVPVASVLGTVAASGKRVCPGEKAASDALDLWEQARAGLLASVVARESQPPRMLVRSFWKTVDPARKRVLSDSVDIKEVVGDRSYVAARPAWAFAESGYMREGPGGSRDYFAPDEAVLLDPSFAAGHCLHVVEGRGPRQAEIGIAFDPIADAHHDTIVDIAGALWLDRGKLALRSVEFQYTNLERMAKDAGGVIGFVLMPNGVPMIDEWHIRSPILAFDNSYEVNGVRRRPPPRPDRVDVRLLGFRETGGQVGYAEWPNGLSWRGETPRIVGTVVDRTGASVPRARVWMRGSRDTVTADSTGSFTLPHVFPGIHVVLASDSVLAAAGVSRAVPLAVPLFQAGDRTLAIELYSRAEVLPLVCPAKSYKPGTGVILARVVDGNGAIVPGAKVEVETRQLLVAGDTVSERVWRKGEAGDDGRFVICGAARDRVMVVRAFNGRDSVAVAIDRWQDEVAAITLVLRPPTG